MQRLEEQRRRRVQSEGVSRATNLETQCRSFFESTRLPTLTTSFEGFYQHKAQSGVLRPNQIKALSEKLLQDILAAERWSFHALSSPATYHASKTHHFIDTIRQCRLAAVGITDHSAVRSLCQVIIWLHLLDDLQEAGHIDVRDFIRHLVESHAENRPVPRGNRGHHLRTHEILLRMQASYKEILRGLPREDHEYRSQIFIFGLQRMFAGEKLFGDTDLTRERHKEILLRFIGDSSPDAVIVQNLVKSLPRLYTAFTVNSLMEVIEAYRKQLPARHLIQMQNLIYGPLINSHNVEREIEKEGRSTESVPGFEMLRTSLVLVENALLALSSEEDKILVLERLPWILEAFSGVMPKAAKRIYSKFLENPEIRRLIPSWSDEEIGQLLLLLQE